MDGLPVVADARIGGPERTLGSASVIVGALTGPMTRRSAVVGSLLEKASQSREFYVVNLHFSVTFDGMTSRFVMPRYFTDLQFGDKTITEQKEIETLSLKTARIQAIKALQKFDKGSPTSVYKLTSSVTVRDERGNILARVSLSRS